MTEATAAERYPLAVLAAAEVDWMRGHPADVAGVLQNLCAAEELGQLVRFIEPDGSCVGFISWLRLTTEQLLRVTRHGVRFFGATDNTPGAPVCFIMEQLNGKGYHDLSRRMRMLSALPGVQILAGWRGDRLRLYQTRGYRFFSEAH